MAAYRVFRSYIRGFYVYVAYLRFRSHFLCPFHFLIAKNAIHGGHLTEPQCMTERQETFIVRFVAFKSFFTRSGVSCFPRSFPIMASFYLGFDNEGSRIENS